MTKKYANIQQDRRNVLRLLAGSGVLLMCGTGGYLTRINAANVPVNTATINDPRYRWLTTAIRAPSSHNMQPWMVALPSEKQDILLYLRPGSMLPHADPTNRQAMISLGGFLELLIMAAQSDGYNGKVSLTEELTDNHTPVAHIKFHLANLQPSSDGLLPFISQRTTCHAPFITTRKITEAQLNILRNEGKRHGVNSCGSNISKMVSFVSDLAIKAWLAELEDLDILRETLSVTRIGRKEIEQYRDGIAVQGFLPELAATLGMFPRDRIPEHDSTVMKSMRDMGKQQAFTSVAWMWLVSENNTLAQQIAAGRSFVRVHLRASQLGIELQPMSQLLEKSPSLATYRSELYNGLDITDSECIQMLFRLGFAQADSPDSYTPRRTIDVIYNR